MHSYAVKSKWVRWKGNNHDARAGKPCKDKTLNVPFLEDIAKLFPEGAFLKWSAGQLQHKEQSCSISHFGMAQGEHVSQYEMRGLATSRVAREGTHSLICCSHQHMVKFVREAEQLDGAKVISPDRTAGAPQEHVA